VITHASRFTPKVLRFTFSRTTHHVSRITLSVILLCLASHALAVSPEVLFQDGAQAYRVGDYPRAIQAFRSSLSRRLASGTLQNLGNAEWQAGRTGEAILAWERALWLDPLNQPAHNNLRFARKVAQLEAPDLAWFEVVSSWLPANWWAWTASLSFWLALGIGLVPGILRLRKASWQQAIAALGLMVFLLSVPAQAGIQSRSQIAFILQKDTLLRLTPTSEAQVITRLAAGESVRCERTRGRFVLIRTARTLGWLEQNQLGFLCPNHKSGLL
jgi:tetratricopeptide (TPR) repeat protein